VRLDHLLSKEQLPPPSQWCLVGTRDAPIDPDIWFGWGGSMAETLVNKPLLQVVGTVVLAVCGGGCSCSPVWWWGCAPCWVLKEQAVTVPGGCCPGSAEGARAPQAGLFWNASWRLSVGVGGVRGVEALCRVVC
jgi:hypothetical protein